MFHESQLEELYKTLGKNIKLARCNKNLTQIKLAEQLNISRASLVNIEVGRQRPPLHLLYFISKILEVNLTDFLPKIEEFEGEINQLKDRSVLKSIDQQSEGVNDIKERLIGFIKQQKSKPK